MRRAVVASLAQGDCRPKGPSMPARRAARSSFAQRLGSRPIARGQEPPRRNTVEASSPAATAIATVAKP
jgi:hypothetical protein